MNIMEDIKSKLKEMQDQHQAHTDHLAKLKESVSKSEGEIEVVKSRISAFDGAIQAFNICLQLAQPNSTSETS